MNTKNLDTFITVTKYNSINAAADALFISSPALQQQINRLETEIGAVIRHLQALRCDGAGFGDAAVRQCLTVQDWEALSWRDVYAEAEVAVTVNLTCREK